MSKRLANLGKEMRNLATGKMIVFSLILGITYWIVEPLILHRNDIVAHIVAPYWHEFWMRFMVIIALIVFGGIAQFTINIRNEVEKELKESEERLETIVNTIQTGMIIIDPETHKIVDLNPAAEEAIGYTSQNISGFTCYDFFDSEDKDLCPITGEKNVDSSEHLLLNSKGEKVPIIKTATTVTLNGREHVLESFMDITRRKKAEEELKEANEKLKKGDKLKSQFLNVASHELRTPLTPTIAQLQMVIHEYFGEVTEEQKESLQMVLRNIQSLDRLIEDILDISRLETGTMKFIMSQTDFNKTVERAVGTMRNKAVQKNINIILKQDTIPVILVDKERVTQVLINLIDNAIKFTDDGGEIYVDVENGEDQVAVRVRDTGVGIKPEDAERIFKPFEQVELIKSGKDSSGLGLAICRGIVNSHGGDIWVESEHEKGSTFTFTVPYDQDARKVGSEQIRSVLDIWG